MRGFLQTRASTLEHARNLRRNQTPAEATLWRAIRSQGVGTKARRQVTVGHYILDFAFVPQHLAIEVDGDSHFTPEGQAADALRTEWLANARWRVLRFTNSEVLQNLDGVLQTIVVALSQPPHPTPLPTGEGVVE